MSMVASAMPSSNGLASLIDTVIQLIYALIQIVLAWSGRPGGRSCRGGRQGRRLALVVLLRCVWRPGGSLALALKPHGRQSLSFSLHTFASILDEHNMINLSSSKPDPAVHQMGSATGHAVQIYADVAQASVDIRQPGEK